MFSGALSGSVRFSLKYGVESVASRYLFHLN